MASDFEPRPLCNLGFHSVGSRSDLLSLWYSGILMGGVGVRGGSISRGVEEVEGVVGGEVAGDAIAGVMGRIGLTESLRRQLIDELVAWVTKK
jgi:hypothetical protein